MGKYFGTDGVRGVANQELTVELALGLGQVGAYKLSQGGGQKKMLLGRDPRISGQMLEGALVAGITSMGVDVICAGEIPTSGVAYLVKKLGLCGGVMISASHNPIGDNGIKFFSSTGYKLWDEEEEELESLLLPENLSSLPRPLGLEVGRVTLYHDALEVYLSFLQKSIATRLQGLHLVVDAAHGATSLLISDLFSYLGAKVTAIHATPDGSKINVSCGATDTRHLQEKTLEVGADIGLALDGDGDRLIMVDERGQVRDGDDVMAICGPYMKEKGLLAGETVVATPYSNLGLSCYLKEVGIHLEEAKNGDRYVLKRMLDKGYMLGGEQSGHIIFLQDTTTGDGLLSALKILEVMKIKGESLSSLSSSMEKFPQILKNVSVVNKDWEEEEEIKKAIEEGKRKLGSEGRILVRSSGTEPLIRVMVEGRDEKTITDIASKLGGIVEGLLG